MSKRNKNEKTPYEEGWELGLSGSGCVCNYEKDSFDQEEFMDGYNAGITEYYDDTDKVDKLNRKSKKSDMF